MASDNGTPPPIPQPEGNVLRMIIDMDLSDFSVKIGGPLDQRALCYGMLEMAREILIKRAFTRAAGSGLVVVPGGALPPALKG